jgi:hypothetical protein
MRLRLIVALCLLVPTIAAAQEKPVALTLFPERLPEAGETIRVVATLTQDGKPLTEDNLKTVHTQKIHLLVIDPSLSDYQHLHPTPTATPGSYVFTFTPKFSGGYRAWADVTPLGDNEQFAMADLGEPKIVSQPKTESLRAEVDGYRFVLSLDSAPKAGGMVMATILVIDPAGKNMTALEPVMGAFAHLAGFYDDYQTVLHAHPIGEEPKSDNDRGGPQLMFHLMPEKPGFVKLFAQFKINGKDIFVPFGITVVN